MFFFDWGLDNAKVFQLSAETNISSDSDSGILNPDLVADPCNG
jgi:hypothetical protein